MTEIYEERRAQMFPKLDTAQIARVASHAERRPMRAGEVLFEQGSTNPGVYVLLSGELEVVRPGLAGDDPIVVHQAGEFTGEANVLSGRRSLVRGRVRKDGEVLYLGEHRELWQPHLKGHLKNQHYGTDQSMEEFLHTGQTLRIDRVFNSRLKGSN